MQNSSIEFLFEKLNILSNNTKKNSLFEEHIGQQVIDLLFFKPKKILSAKVFSDLEKIEYTTNIIIKVKVIKHYQNYFNKKVPYRIAVSCNNKKVTLIFFSKYTGYLKKFYPLSQEIFIKGKLELYNNNFQITHPEIINEKLIKNKKSLHEVVYKQKKLLQSQEIHSLILKACSYLPKIEEWNVSLIEKYKNIPGFKESILNIHSPKEEGNLSSTSPYITRLAYDEIFAYQLSLAILRNNFRELDSNKFSKNYSDVLKYMHKILPYELTKDQERCTLEIIKDIKSNKRTLRLLHGDVGSGKTVVAMITAFFVIKSGYQVAFLAPTELLAKQHFKFFTELFKKENIKSEILLASSTDKKNIKEKLRNNQIEMIIGTHSLIQSNVRFSNLSLVIIDEQHRFGVEQRLKIREKGKKVDTLLLTATPIPRTMMLTMLGDISVSTIKKKPFDARINTILKNEKNINEVVSYIKNKILSKQKIFWVCPKIEDEKLENNYNVEKRFIYLKKHFDKVSVLHGKMKPYEKVNALEDFREGKINLLVSTVVIEVGIDVPDANIIVIDNANRFGLAQIHHLRGRVGRGSNEGVCILLYNDELSEIALERLLIMKKSQNGFEIAEKDLELRGSGEIMGTKQYGAEEFKFFNYQFHLKLAKLAIKEAENIIKTNPKLKNKRGESLKKLLKLFKKNDATNLLSAG